MKNILKKIIIILILAVVANIAYYALMVSIAKASTKQSTKSNTMYSNRAWIDIEVQSVSTEEDTFLWIF